MVDWVLAVIAAGGLAGVAALMFAENLFPPIPSEVILPLAGYAAARGDLPLAGVIAAATVGAVAGASVWKAVGRVIPETGLRRWIDLRGRWLLPILIMVAAIEAVAEAMRLGQAAGVDPARLKQALAGGSAASRVLDIMGERMVQRNFVPGIEARLHH